MMNKRLLIYKEAVMDMKQKSALTEQACAKSLQYELDCGCCPQCAHAAGAVTRWVIGVL